MFMGKQTVKIISKPSLKNAGERKEKTRIIRPSFSSCEELKQFSLNKKYYIRTYGCQANIRDEEVFAGLLEKSGFKKTNNQEDADVIILNTCAVRENAEDKVYGEIGTLKSLKAKKPPLIICVCGCMVQQEHTVDFILEKYKHVDIIWGTHNAYLFLDLLLEFYKHKCRIVDVKSETGDIYEGLPSKRKEDFKSFVNITYGCDKFCTYCIVPYTRGKERSRLKEDILKECQSLVNNGYQEITLLGQNVNAYGKDFHDGTTFAVLLDEVAKLGIPRLRFLTSHPWDFSKEMIDVIKKHNNIMKYIHLPLQSGNDDILRLMGRRYNASQYIELVKAIRKEIPDIAISTDIIVGFPNETREQFLDTLKICEEVEYDSAFTFIYSPRKGTPAARINDNVSNEEKHYRFNELVKCLEKSISNKAQAMVGKTYKVLVDGLSKKNDEVLSGYTESNKLVNFYGNKCLIGRIVNVKITDSKTYSLFGELIDE